MFIHIFFSIFGKFWLHESALLAAMKKFWLQYGSIKFIIHCAFTASTIELLSSLCTKFQIIKWLLQKLKEQCKQWTVWGCRRGRVCREGLTKSQDPARLKGRCDHSVTTVLGPSHTNSFVGFWFYFLFFFFCYCCVFCFLIVCLDFDDFFYLFMIWKDVKERFKKIFIFPKQSLLTLF